MKSKRAVPREGGHRSFVKGSPREEVQQPILVAMASREEDESPLLRCQVLWEEKELTSISGPNLRQMLRCNKC